MAASEHALEPRVLLASTSVTRRTLLQSAGLSFTAVAPSIDEDAVRVGLMAAGRGHLRLAEDLAAAKAVDISKDHPTVLVIGADQILVVGDRLLTKPGDRAGVVSTLRLLRDRTHGLVTGVVLAEAGRIVWRHTAQADLTMRDLTDADIERYANRVGTTVFGSVGAYHIEGLGMTLFTAVAGDHTAILGLPMLPLLGELRNRGILMP